MAKLSLRPVAVWNTEIQSALRASLWVIFLASRAACSSPYVQQEVGGAVFGGKQLVPIVWEMPPTELPGWASQYQAPNLRGMAPQQVAQQIAAIAQRIHIGKHDGLLIAAAVIGGLLFFGDEE